MIGFIRGMIAGVLAALAATWRLVWTPLGWIWKREPTVPVTPAQAVAVQEEGRRAVEDFYDDKTDNVLRY